MLDELGFRTVSSRFDPYNYIDTNILEADFGRDEILLERIDEYCEKHHFNLSKQKEMHKLVKTDDEKTL